MMLGYIFVFFFSIIMLLFIIGSVNGIYYSIKLWLHYQSQNINKHDIIIGKGLGPLEQITSINDRMKSIFYEVDKNDDQIIVEYKHKLKQTRTLMRYIAVMILSMILILIFIDILNN